jgi:hypothetical protein
VYTYLRVLGVLNCVLSITAYVVVTSMGGLLLLNLVLYYQCGVYLVRAVYASGEREVSGGSIGQAVLKMGFYSAVWKSPVLAGWKSGTGTYCAQLGLASRGFASPRH